MGPIEPTGIIEGLGIIIRKVNGLADFDVTFADCLPGIEHHGSNRFTALAGKLRGHFPQDRSSASDAPGFPGGLRGDRDCQGCIDILKVGFGVLISSYPRPRWVLSLAG